MRAVTATRCRPTRCAACAATPTSCRSCSAATAWPSTWDGRSACARASSASLCGRCTAAVPIPVAASGSTTAASTTSDWWDHGGRTDLANLLPLCEAHHHLVHEGHWTLTVSPDRTITLRRPDGSLHYEGNTTTQSAATVPPTQRPPSTSDESEPRPNEREIPLHPWRVRGSQPRPTLAMRPSLQRRPPRAGAHLHPPSPPSDRPSANCSHPRPPSPPLARATSH